MCWDDARGSLDLPAAAPSAAGQARGWLNWATLSPSSPGSLPSPLLSSLQAELSLQKEQLQLKIIEVEDEVDKWQKERDRIKVSLGCPIHLLESPILLPCPVLQLSLTPSLPQPLPHPYPQLQAKSWKQQLPLKSSCDIPCGEIKP